jgi:DNA repair exonuclease SbcCD nuclease subunit
MGIAFSPDSPDAMLDRITPVRILLLADSHLGFDLPLRPRVDRRRRGHDFLANHEKALAPATGGEVDLVVHGGDIFHRPRVPPSLVFQAFNPILEIAESGIPVFVVPGNHERSRVPHGRFATHPHLHLFHRPGTVVVGAGQTSVAISGFPYERRRIRERFPQVLEDTGWRRNEADLRLLCMHHCVEGAVVGPADYTFRSAPDVIRCVDLPTGFAAVLSGHIHRHQVLRRDLQGRALSTPVFYPGSVERTAFAEMDEEKGYVLMEAAPGAQGGRVVRHEFVRLSARPMVAQDLKPTTGLGTTWVRDDLEAQLDSTLADVPKNAVLRARIHGRVPSELRTVVAADHLRRLAPREMNLEVILVEDRTNHRSGDSTHRQQSASRRKRRAEAPTPGAQLQLLDD